ncbi:hypothetical protein ACS0TY_017505 [Phlomoides rotata]
MAISSTKICIFICLLVFASVDEVVSQCKCSTSIGLCEHFGCIVQCLAVYPDPDGGVSKAVCEPNPNPSRPPLCVCVHNCPC